MKDSSQNERHIIQAIRKGDQSRDRALKTIFKDSSLREVVKRVQEEGGGKDSDFFPLFKDCVVFFDRYVRWFPQAGSGFKQTFEKIAKYKWSKWLRDNEQRRTKAIGFVAEDQEILPRLKARIQNGGGRAEDAENFYQQGFIKLHEQLSDGKYRGGALRGYFFQVCYNLWRNDIRRIKPVDPGEEGTLIPSDQANPYESLELKEFREKWYRAFLRLNKACRKILTLKFFRRESFTMEEIARQTGYKNAQNASNALHRCKKRWRELIVE